MVNKENNMYIELNLSRTYALADLISKCAKEDIIIDKVRYIYNGFWVSFQGFEGVFILHDGLSGRDLNVWETYGMPWDNKDTPSPWDNKDVPTHTTDDLIALLKEYKK